MTRSRYFVCCLFVALSFAISPQITGGNVYAQEAKKPYTLQKKKFFPLNRGNVPTSGSQSKFILNKVDTNRSLAGQESYKFRNLRGEKPTQHRMTRMGTSRAKHKDKEDELLPLTADEVNALNSGSSAAILALYGEPMAAAQKGINKAKSFEAVSPIDSVPLRALNKVQPIY